MCDDFMSFGELRIEGAVERRIPLDDPAFSGRVRPVWRMLPDDRISIFIRRDVVVRILSQCRCRPSEEVGGMMLGGFFTDGPREWVLVENVLAAEHVLASSHSLRFTHDTWAAMTRAMAARQGGGRVVGWYHSHPKSPAFLSEDDNFIHRNFFPQYWQVAVVVSLRDDVFAAFQWREDVLVGRCGYYLIEDRR